jgi:hypothetical protein
LAANPEGADRKPLDKHGIGGKTAPEKYREENRMLGLMQHWPLLCHKILDHAAIQHGRREVVSRSVEGPIVRTTYAAIRDRALRIAQGDIMVLFSSRISARSPGG